MRSWMRQTFSTHLELQDLFIRYVFFFFFFFVFFSMWYMLFDLWFIKLFQKRSGRGKLLLSNRFFKFSYLFLFFSFQFLVDEWQKETKQNLMEDEVPVENLELYNQHVLAVLYYLGSTESLASVCSRYYVLL